MPFCLLPQQSVALLDEAPWSQENSPELRDEHIHIGCPVQALLQLYQHLRQGGGVRDLLYAVVMLLHVGLRVLLSSQRPGSGIVTAAGPPMVEPLAAAKRRLCRIDQSYYSTGMGPASKEIPSGLLVRTVC